MMRFPPELVRNGILVRHLRAARRMRLEIPGLFGRPELAHRIETDLSKVPGIRRATASATSGRVLIEYAPGTPPPLQAEKSLPSPVQNRRRERLFPWKRSPRIGIAQAAEPWHTLSPEKALECLKSGFAGLSEAEARQRLDIYGPNAGLALEARSRLGILLAQLTNLPTLLLLGSSTLSVLLRNIVESGAILSVVGLNSSIGYWIESTSEELLASWRKLEAGEVQVLRGGHFRQVAAADLVPGDIILCRSGDVVPADARVIEAHRLSCNESTLTGETESQAKHTSPVKDTSALADRTSMLYMGTTVAAGHGRAVVVATGAATEIAQVRRLLEAERTPETPLERRLNRMTNRFAAAGVGAGLLSGLAGLAYGRPVADVVRRAVALGVAAIPEGLPVVSTAALVRAMQRMRERGMVVRRLASAETLGGVTVICADKTGTLTENAMRLELLEIGGQKIAAKELRAQRSNLLRDPATLALAAGVLNSDVDVQGHGLRKEVVGSSTERALVAAATVAGLSRTELRNLYPRRALRERSEGVHYVISIHDAPGGERLTFVKGAPEQVITMCNRDLRRKLTPAARRRLLTRSDALAADGLRVLALGWKRLHNHGPDDLEGGYTLIGLAALRDPLREGTADAIHRAARAGIRTVILTGDHRRTAESVARAVGLTGEVLDGPGAMKLLESGDVDRVCGASVIARITPAEKVAIVRALREHGEVVAMAGDGINDAPALKAADIGVAVGVGASDLARHAADVVLENGDLRSILSAVSEGRIVQDNLRRALRYLLATNSSELALVLGSALIGARDPLSPLQLLWINLLTDTFPALALALEPGGNEVLGRPPSPPGAPLLSPAEQQEIARDGLALAALGAGALWIGGPALAFSTITGAQLGYAALCRAPNGPPSERFNLLLGSAAGLQLLALAFPPLRGVLGLPGGVSPLEIAGFGAGLAIRVLTTNHPGDTLIVRHGSAYGSGSGRSILMTGGSVR